MKRQTYKNSHFYLEGLKLIGVCWCEEKNGRKAQIDRACDTEAAKGTITITITVTIRSNSNVQVPTRRARETGGNTTAAHSNKH